MIGERLAHYQILDKLGQGGMGEVYLAADSKLGREVAVKILPADIAQDRVAVARLLENAGL